MPWTENPVRASDAWDEDSEEFAEGYTDGCDGSALDDQEEGPSIEEAPERSERLAQINVLASGLRHHRGEFSVGECGGDGHEACDEPCGDQQRGGRHEAGNV